MLTGKCRLPRNRRSTPHGFRILVATARCRAAPFSISETAPGAADTTRTRRRTTPAHPAGTGCRAMLRTLLRPPERFPVRTFHCVVDRRGNEPRGSTHRLLLGGTVRLGTNPLGDRGISEVCEEDGHRRGIGVMSRARCRVNQQSNPEREHVADDPRVADHTNINNTRLVFRPRQDNFAGRAVERHEAGRDADVLALVGNRCSGRPALDPNAPRTVAQDCAAARKEEGTQQVGYAHGCNGSARGRARVALVARRLRVA